jgi:hypothetical protein
LAKRRRRIIDDTPAVPFKISASNSPQSPSKVTTLSFLLILLGLLFSLSFPYS